MLSGGQIKEMQFIQELMWEGIDGCDVRTLPSVLGESWESGVARPSQLEKVLKRGPFAAELRNTYPDRSYWRSQLGHTVVVDGADESGLLNIRDPQHGTMYKMHKDDFLKHWTGAGTWRKAGVH